MNRDKRKIRNIEETTNSIVEEQSDYDELHDWVIEY